MRLSFSITIDAEDDEVAGAVSRVARALREAGLVTADAPPTIEAGAEVQIWPIARRVIHRGTPLDLTRREFDLLLFLSEHPDRVHSRQQVMAAVWGIDDGRGLRTVDVHVRRLRQKLGAAADVITTVRGVGYVVASSGRVRVHRDQELRLASVRLSEQDRRAG